MAKLMDVATAQEWYDGAKAGLAAAKRAAQSRPSGDSDWLAVERAQVEFNQAQSALQDAKANAQLQESNTRARQAAAEREAAEAERIANRPPLQHTPGDFRAKWSQPQPTPPATDQHKSAAAKKGKPKGNGKSKPKGKGTGKSGKRPPTI
jgi:hypothetical protein